MVFLALDFKLALVIPKSVFLIVSGNEPRRKNCQGILF